MHCHIRRLAVIAIVAALAGCGGDGGGGDEGDQREEARDVVVRYFRDVVADRSEKACQTYLTKQGVINIYGKESCREVFDFVLGPVRVESVEEAGDEVRVVVYLSRGTEDKRVVTLREEGGSLKIEDIERPSP